MSSVVRIVPVGAFALLSLLPVAGCSSSYKVAKVRGRIVTCEGKPATGGLVVFVPVDDPDRTGRRANHAGYPSSGVVQADGSFELATEAPKPETGALVGPHKIYFKMPPTERPIVLPSERENFTPEELKKKEAEFAAMPIYPKVPCSDAVEPAEVEVKAGGNSFEFKLRAK